MKNWRKTAVDAAVLAGGLGTRLRPVVDGIPKVLAKVDGRPFLDTLLERLGALGVRRTVLCTGYLASQIRTHCGERRGDMQLVHSQESVPLGTAGALRLALPWFTADTVLVLNGDSYYRGNLAPFLSWHFRKRALVSILLARTNDTARYGRVEAARTGEIRRFREKDPADNGPGWVNAGVYLMQTAAIERIPGGRPCSLEKEFFPSRIGRRLYGYRGRGEFLDIGTPDSYARAGSFLHRSKNKSTRQQI